MKTQRNKIGMNTSPNISPFCSIHVGSRLYIKPAEIVMISAEISYSFIYLLNGKRILVSTNIQKLQERFLGVQSMVRVHRSYIINTIFLKHVEGVNVYLENDNQCIISRRKRVYLFNTNQLN